MKASEAPEKLWWSKGAVWQTNPNSKRYIEFTRTDAFIEKACEWLKDNVSNYATVHLYSTEVNIEEDEMIEDFKKYMER